MGLLKKNEKNEDDVIVDGWRRADAATNYQFCNTKSHPRVVEIRQKYGAIKK